MDVVVLAGGKGTRLWPISRKGLPKHLVSLFGEMSLFQQTIIRAFRLISQPTDRIIIVTNAEQKRLLSQQIENLRIETSVVDFLIEPVGRNTAPALLWAVFELSKKKSDSTVLMLPSDHMIVEEDIFVEQMQNCAQFVQEQSKIVVFGVKPNYPATGYGYIEAVPTENYKLKEDVFYKVAGFKEKPNKELAQQYLQNDNFFWNSGMLMFKLSSLINEAKLHIPDMSSKIEEFVNEGAENIEPVYNQLTAISLDYALLEKTDILWVMPVRFGWSDMGSWSAVYELKEKDENGNAVIGEAILLDCNDSLIIGPKNKSIGIINQKNLIVIDTPDSLLICNKADVERVKEIADRLERGCISSWVDPAKVERGWGYYIVLDRGARFKTKRIVVYPGKAISLQRHQHRSEHWVVLRGVAKVRRADEVFYVHPNESTYIPAGIIHKLENPGKIPLEIIEVQNGDYLEEDDIERLD